jgi:hypothetical protein
VHGYRSPDNPLLSLRDHVYQGRGFRYIEPDVKSLLEAFRDAQRPDGSLPDWLDMPALGVKSGRKEVEADVEFLFAQGVYEAWQMSGDDAWMRQMLPAVQRALRVYHQRSSTLGCQTRVNPAASIRLTCGILRMGRPPKIRPQV